MKIRKAIVKDIEQIQRLRRLLEEYEKEELDNNILNINWVTSKNGIEDTQYFITKQYCFVAIEDNKIVGVLLGEVLPQEEWYTEQIATLDNIFVLKEYRRRGIGQELYNYFKEDIKNKGIRIIELHTLSNNKNAISFYKKIGFEPYNLQMLNKEI